MGQIDVAEGEGPGDERRVFGIELPFDPIGPHPVQIVLDRLGVEEASGMKLDSFSYQFNGLGNLGGLGKSAHLGHEGQRIQYPMGAGCTPKQEL
jgi:hypothetical protein